ncbi:VQ motif containing protein [Trema orientale]|uniref:VQ motif containing protein n=1 Tax=Trema orientale TaxID=63057 RepID=A0A2P5BXC3_TREOI|nr:VQ motif containing protein [Trema orientale]
MSGSRTDYHTKPPKVVIINTQYVETDAVSFKDVVQKLTGKDSKVAEDGGDGERAKRRSDHKPESSTSCSSSSIHDEYGSSSGGNSVLTRDISFKEFERFLREMPPIDEMWPSD